MNTDSNKPKIMIIVGSTRPGRIGRAIADWFYGQAARQTDLQFEMVDLADWKLPMLDESAPPKMQMYQHEHTKKWSAKIAAADGFVIVTPEYNHGYPASLKNALDYLYHEWGGKPVAFVGYGWGGGRMAVDQLLQVAEELRMRPLAEQILIPFAPDMFDERHQIAEPEVALRAHNDKVRVLTQALTAATALRAGVTV